jgi:hypothetical protein
MTAFGDCADGHIQDHFNFDGDKTIDSHEKTSPSSPMDSYKLDENNAVSPIKSRAEALVRSSRLHLFPRFVSDAG